MYDYNSIHSFSQIDWMNFQVISSLESNYYISRKTEIKQELESIVTKFGLCPHRISTTNIVNIETVKKIINELNQVCGNT